MENNVNVWKANLTNGIILGLIGVVYSMIMYFFDLTFNQLQGWIFYLLEIIVLYFMVKSYRDNYCQGNMTFGQGLGAGMVIFLYNALIAAVFIYILYTFIDANLMDKQLAMSEQEMIKRGLPQEAIDMSLKIQEKIFKPIIMAPISILGSMFAGLIMSLIVAAFTRKEGNPLIDTPEEEPAND
jgi:hypothetical protein